MKILLLLIAIALGSYHTVQAASVRYDSAQFYWTYTDNPNSPGINFLLQCGKSPGNYTTKRFLPIDIRAVLIKNILPRQNGTYYCTMLTVGEEGSSSIPTEKVFRIQGQFINY